MSGRGTPSPLYAACKFLFFNSLRLVAICKIVIINELRPK